MQSNDTIRRPDRIKSEYAKWFLKLEKQGYDLFFLTLLFKSRRKEYVTSYIRIESVEAFYSRLLSRTFRKVCDEKVEVLPKLFLWLEHSSEVQCSSNISPNEAAHYHGILVSPKPGFGRLNFEDRLQATIDTQAISNSNIARIHYKQIRGPTAYNKVFQYCHKRKFKAPNSDFSFDDIILPKLHSEMPEDRAPNTNIIQDTVRKPPEMSHHVNKKDGTSMTDGNYLTRQEVADHLSISVNKLDALRRSGDAPTEIKLGRSVRFKLRDVIQWQKGIEKKLLKKRSNARVSEAVKSKRRKPNLRSR